MSHSIGGAEPHFTPEEFAQLQPTGQIGRLKFERTYLAPSQRPGNPAYVVDVRWVGHSAAESLFDPASGRELRPEDAR